MEIPLATEHDHREHNHDWDKNTKNTFQDQCTNIHFHDHNYPKAREG